jgi:general secretion pathway protein L
LCWRDGSESDEKTGGPLDAAADDAIPGRELTLVLPAHKVLLQSVEFAPHERRLLRQTVPYSFEEQLIVDVDEQHFALGKVDGQSVPVAIVDKQWLAQWLTQCAQAGLDIKHVVPEQFLLPYRTNCWTLLIDGDRWLVRIGLHRGFALEADSAALALQLLLDGADEMPEKLLVCGAASIETLSLQLPELLRGSVEMLGEREVDPAAATGSIDLLQGVFARTLPWRRWWQQWQWPALILVAAFLTHMVVLGVQYYRLKQHNLALRQQIEQIYRTIEPRGVINDPELQLRRKLAALQNHNGDGAIALLQQVGGALHGVDGVHVQNMTFSERQNELRISLSAGTFKDIETVRMAIANTGLNAQLVGSNTDGDKTRAQLRVTATR